MREKSFFILFSGVQQHGETNIENVMLFKIFHVKYAAFLF